MYGGRDGKVSGVPGGVNALTDQLLCGGEPMGRN